METCNRAEASRQLALSKWILASAEREERRKKDNIETNQLLRDVYFKRRVKRTKNWVGN